MLDHRQFEEFVVDQRRHQRLLARIGVNALGFHEEFPVDLAELKVLSGVARGAVREFLVWVATHPCAQFTKDNLLLVDIARNAITADSGDPPAAH